MLAELLLAILLALTCLYWWVRDREKEKQRRIDNCIHPPTRQIDLRVGGEPVAMGDRKIPGARMVIKHCEACGWQRPLYSPRLKPWKDYLAEFEQETIDRQAEFVARRREFEAEQRYKEAQRGRSSNT